MPATISVNFATQGEVEGATPPTNKSVSASVLRAVLNSGAVTGGYVTLGTAQSITGQKTFTQTILGSVNGDAGTVGGITTARILFGDNSTKTRNVTNVNNALPSGSYDFVNIGTANGAPVAGNIWYHMLHSRHINEGNNYAMQICQQFGVVNETYVRTINNNTPSAWCKLWHSGNSTELISQILPAGMVMPFARNAAPAGWLPCNGASVTTAAYPNLFASIGYTYGGTGANFNVPDLRGMFVRGHDAGRGADAGRVFGSYQVDTMQNLWGQFQIAGTEGAVVANGVFGVPGSGGRAGGGHNPNPWNPLYDFQASRVARVSDENRPENYAMLYCIKF